MKFVLLMYNLEFWRDGVMMKRVIIAAVGVFVVCVFGGISQATYIYTFQAFTEAGVYYDVPELAPTMEIYNGLGLVKFKFSNLSSQQSSIARIYFDDGSLLVGPTVTGTQGVVSFDDVFPGPGNLPGGSNVGFVADREFSIGSEASPPENGINEYPAYDEWLEITYTLDNPLKTVEDVKAELDNGDLRVGIHIISLDPEVSGEGSISMVNIPEPATMCMLGLGALMFRKRRL